MRRAFAIAACVIFCAGCAQTTWVKPGATASDFDQAKLECQYEAQKATAGGLMGSMGDAAAAGWRQGELETTCMRVKGWSRQAQAK